jgi:hypothetical protein
LLQESFALVFQPPLLSSAPAEVILLAQVSFCCSLPASVKHNKNKPKEQQKATAQNTKQRETMHVSGCLLITFTRSHLA